MNFYILECIKLQKKDNFKRGLSMTYKNYASILNILGQNAKAMHYLKLSYTLAEEMHYVRGLKASALLMSRIYRSQKKHKEALRYLKIYIKMRDSLSNNENRIVSMKAQMQYEYEKKAATDSIKAAEQDKIIAAQKMAQWQKQERNKTLRKGLMAGLIISGIFLLIFFNRLRLIQKQKALIEIQKEETDSAYLKLEEKNKEVLDSIQYASRIQRALITDEKTFHKLIQRIRQ
jgi:hypothetical protein